MSPEISAAVSGSAGLALGVPALRWLRTGSYLCPDESPRRHPWFLPAVAVAAAAAGYGLAARPLVVLAVGVISAVVGVTVAAVDAHVMRIPRAITWPSYPILGLLMAIPAVVTGDWGSLPRAIAAGAVCWAGFYLVHRLPGCGLGRGDVTLAGLFGAFLGWLSWGSVVIGIYATLLTSALAAAYLRLVRGHGRGHRFAFGPAMVTGAVVAMALSR